MNEIDRRINSFTNFESEVLKAVNLTSSFVIEKEKGQWFRLSSYKWTSYVSFWLIFIRKDEESPQDMVIDSPTIFKRAPLVQRINNSVLSVPKHKRSKLNMQRAVVMARALSPQMGICNLEEYPALQTFLSSNSGDLPGRRTPFTKYYNQIQ